MNLQHRTNVCNILVIGSGGAGLRAAIAAHQAGADVIVMGKRLKTDAHTVLASGGINAALGTVDPQDSWQQHFSDTMREGYFLANPRVVELLAREAPQHVLELADWGCNFNRTAEGQLDQRFFGAHKYRRTCYAGDFTGREILYTLVNKAQEYRIPLHEHKYVSRLLIENGVCFGAMSFDIHSGERVVYLADAVILAAGGHTRIWRKSSSRRDENTGDGVFLALQAGCALADMELVQFHPTGMVYPESMAGVLVTEAVRGEGGRLYNSLGERFMERYDAERLELSTRDRVALANYSEIMAGRGGPNGGVFLDISHRDKRFILEKLPRMYRQFMESTLLDISQEAMEVAPTAHYSMGGVVVDPESHRTAVVGLYAAGEVTSGVHGANRLGGNSLAEVLVFGQRAGEHAAAYSAGLKSLARSPQAVQEAHEELDALIRDGEELARPNQRALRNLMWHNCGVVRDGEGLQQGLAQLDGIKAALAHIDVRPSSEGYQDLALALDLRGSLFAAEATIRSAIERRESRGAHQRSDYPELQEDMRKNIHIRLDKSGQLRASLVDVPPIPDELKPYLDSGEDMPIAGRLLE